MHSLQSIILATLSFKELKKICYGPPTVLKNSLDCDWGLWRERAKVLQGTSPAFFDLPRTFLDEIYPGREVTGIQRYIEVSSYYQLNSQSPVVTLNDAFLRGVYEKMAEIVEASRREEDSLFSYQGSFSFQEEDFLRQEKALFSGYYGLSGYKDLTYLAEKNSHLRQLRKETSEKNFTQTRLVYYLRAGYEEAFSFLLEEEGIYTILLDILRSGKSSFFNRALQEIIKSKESREWSEQIRNLRLERDISPLVFDSRREEFPLTDLGMIINDDVSVRSVFGYTSYELLSAACYGGNVQIVDFFRSLFQEKSLKANVKELEEGYTFHRKPEEFYSILQRWDSSNLEELTASRLLGNVDFLTHIFYRWVKLFALEHTLAFEGLIKVRGNIPSLLALIQFYELWGERDVSRRKRLYAFIARRCSSLFPLSERILEEKSK